MDYWLERLAAIAARTRTCISGRRVRRRFMSQFGVLGSAFLALMAALIPAATFPSPLAAGPETDSVGCSFPGLRLPPEAKVYATGGYKGAHLGWSIDNSGHDSTYVKVAVNSPQAPVALILGAYEPNVWQIGWTEGTEILAVVAAGYHRQKVSGLGPEVPVLISSFQDKGPCGYFYCLRLGGLKPPALAGSFSIGWL